MTSRDLDLIASKHRDPRERLIAALFRVFNPIVRLMVDAGLPTGGPNVLLTVPGRKSGEPHTNPVGVLEFEGRRFVQASFGEVNWVRNLRAAGEAVVTRGRRSETVTATELDPETAGRLLRKALAPYHRSRLIRALLGRTLRPPVGLLRRFRLRIDDSLEDYVAEARRHPVFELRPRTPAATPASAWG